MSNWRAWLIGLIAAALGGVGNSVGMAVVDPAHFNFVGGLHNLAEAAAVGAIIAVAGYLKNRPLPGANDGAPTK